VANVCLGAVPVRLADVVSVLASHLGGPPVAERADAVVWSIRLPHTALAVAVGAALGTAGALLQGVYRNPLAEPGIIGVSAGAAAGAVVVKDRIGLVRGDEPKPDESDTPAPGIVTRRGDEARRRR
jgi:iron complex transport system permease protein